MADRPIINTLASGARLSVTELNDNFDTLADAIEACLGRGGITESPNSITANVDMDLNKIVNLGDPVNAKDAINKSFGDSEYGGAAATKAENHGDYAEEWANKAENSLVSTAAGGDGVDDYSALHQAKKASASASNAATSETNAATSESNAATSEAGASSWEDLAQQWAEEDEDVAVETGKYSAKHYSLKAADYAAAADILAPISYTELRDIDTTGMPANTQASVSHRSTAGDGGGGIFYWDADNLSSSVSSDTESGVYVAPNSDLTGASGAWVRSTENQVSAHVFGVISDELTDQTTKIVAAFDVTKSVKASLYIPPGTMWDYNVAEADHPFDLTIIDDSGYDYDSTNKFSAQYRVIMNTSDPGTKNAHNYFLQAPWNPGLVIKNSSPRVLGQTPQPQSSIIFEDGDTRTFQIVSGIYDDEPILNIRSIYNGFGGGLRQQGTSDTGGTAYSFNTTPTKGTPFKFQAENDGDAVYRWFSSAEAHPTVVQIYKGSTEVQRTTYLTDGSITFNDRINNKTIKFNTDGVVEQNHRTISGDPSGQISPTYNGEMVLDTTNYQWYIGQKITGGKVDWTTFGAPYANV